MLLLELVEGRQVCEIKLLRIYVLVQRVPVPIGKWFQLQIPFSILLTLEGELLGGDSSTLEAVEGGLELRQLGGVALGPRVLSCSSVSKLLSLLVEISNCGWTLLNHGKISIHSADVDIQIESLLLV